MEIAVQTDRYAAWCVGRTSISIKTLRDEAVLDGYLFAAQIETVCGDGQSHSRRSGVPAVASGAGTAGLAPSGDVITVADNETASQQT